MSVAVRAQRSVQGKRPLVAQEQSSESARSTWGPPRYWALQLQAPEGGALQFEEAFVALFAALGSVGLCSSYGWGHRGGGVTRVPVYVADCSNHASVQEVVCEAGYACFIPDLPSEEREGSCRGVGDPVAHLGQL